MSENESIRKMVDGYGDPIDSPALQPLPLIVRILSNVRIAPRTDRRF